ncbi:transporter [Methylocapsa sp. D3K7]|uniref:SphA family protein n=1 Tax=Methylocapsa sp. D3K7 TaxID=3041435 RepID=UPI00244EB85E|nr:transporter [Methylocapsa sp. D3K7]WGJ15121.1 transporter [Methylocapsa sp. D3K7]
MDARRTMLKVAGAACAAVSLVGTQETRAVEYGVGEYFLGLEIPMSGYIPPPGVFFKDSYYLYHGTSPGLNVQFVFNIAQAGYFISTDLFGGATVGIFATVPYVGVENSIPVSFRDSSGLTETSRLNAGISSIGDSDYSAVMGWHEGDNNWLVALTAFTPTGNYNQNRFVQTGLNRPGIDIKGGYTFLSLRTGMEVSAALGMTFNALNTFTNYQSGTELHFEWALNQHFPVGLAVGVGGYFYQQVTNDYGLGDTVGPNKGRVASVGPLLSYTLKVGDQEVNLSGRFFHEFAVQNKTRGDAIYTTLSFRL